MVLLYSCENDVEYAELNYYVYALFVPNDPLYAADQWNFSNSSAGINMQSAWDITFGEPNVIVAVVDTGVAFENYHNFKQAPDLAQTHFVPGYNFVSNTTHPNDDEGHGTHVTGTIAQSTNNNLGVAGIAFNCSIMPVKVLDSTGQGTDTAVADGIQFAASNGAKVINLSLGGTAGSNTMQNAVAYAYSHGVTVVCAAGNDYQSGDPPIYPAAYDAYCIAVGATGINRNHAFYSNTGSYLDVVAPGGDSSAGIVQQTFQGSVTNFGYFSFEGTSMATPHVSGIAALLISHGTIGPDAVREAIQNTARDLGTAGWDPVFGWGLVDAHAALTYRHLPADFNRDGVVDYNDLGIFASFWLQNNNEVDIWPANGDGIADFHDYAILAFDWLMHAQ
jgi:serine protease